MWRIVCWCLTLALCCASLLAYAAERPNVILIMTDDQGYGDFGCHGNPIIRTPNMDRLAGQSARLQYFYVCPACTPTRASLMTGRYNFRTRAIDTFWGRAMMEPGEVTVAEVLQQVGYATGIFGKWHLGDCYPLRAIDQGFQEALVHRGGGIGQPSDPPGGEGKYTDPILFRNGRATPMKGYCTDVFFSEAMQWAGRQSRARRPFFLYLPTNAPHGPFNDVPADKLAYYQKQSIAPGRFPKTPGHPLPEKLDADTLARVYAMVENIDDNLGRLLNWLDREKLADNTLLLFLTDNGPALPDFNAGLRAGKTTPYEGGIRSPLFARWPSKLQPGVCSDRIAAHIDLMPTILEVCGVRGPQGVKLDGRSLLPLWKRTPGQWPDRTLCFQMHRGDVPVRYHNCSVRTQQWKLVHATGFGTETFTGAPKFELFDMTADPYETRDVAAAHPQIVADLQQRYDAWLDDVGHTRPDNYAPPRIKLGTPHENPVVLTRQDARMPAEPPKWRGFWLVDVAAAGNYDLTLRLKPLAQPATARFALGGVEQQQSIAAGCDQLTFTNVALPAGPARLDARVDAGKQPGAVLYVEIARRP